MKLIVLRLFCVVVCVGLTCSSFAQGLGNEPSTGGPVLAHEPVAVAVEGEPLSILTRVAALGSPVKQVTLNYSLSKDGSPVSVHMDATEQGLYMGTIPASHFATANSVWYYIEAVDEADEWAETSWHQVLIKRADDPPEPEFVDPARSAPAPTPTTRTVTPAPTRQPAPTARTTTRTPAPAPAPAPSRGPVIDNRPDNEGLGTPAVVAGGAVLIGAGVIAAIAASDSGGSDDPAPASTNTPPPTMMTTTNGTDSTDTMMAAATPTETGFQCSAEELQGQWSGDAIAPGFTLLPGSAQFQLPGNTAVNGTWSPDSVNCIISLTPPPDDALAVSLYQGTGTVATNGGISVTINGRTFRLVQ